MKWTELHQIWTGHTLIIGAVGVFFAVQVSLVAPFRDEGKSNVTGVENRGQISHYNSRKN